MQETIDLRLYTTIPFVSVESAIPFGRAMIAAAPETMSALVAREFERTKQALEALEAVWQPVAPATGPSEKPPADRRLDRAWSALEKRLGAWDGLAGHGQPEVDLAAAIHGELFPTGLDFLKLEYPRQWAQSQRRLDFVDTKVLGPDIDAPAGPAFLAAVRTAHAHYGVVLGITEAPEAPPEAAPSVAEPFKAFREAITRYVQKLVGTLDDEDPKAVASVRAALAPLDDLRARLSSKSARKVAPADQP